jgi:putative flippase GtrA
MRSGGLLPRLIRQFMSFFGVGVAAAIVHYSVLIGLVELAVAPVIPATLAGYVCGGLLSYGLNRWLTYQSARSHAEAGWRFALVAGIGFVMTWGLMSLFHGQWSWPYLWAQVLTTGIVLVWSFLAHKFWSFGEKA